VAVKRVLSGKMKCKYRGDNEQKEGFAFIKSFVTRSFFIRKCRAKLEKKHRGTEKNWCLKTPVFLSQPVKR